jgi:hypothetical protein
VTPQLVLNGETATNFDVTPVDGAWSITPAPVTMTAGSYSGTYDGASHSLACVVAPTSPNTYKGALTCTSSPSSVKDAGSGTVTPQLVLNGETATNFDVTPVDGAWSITPAPVTATAGGYSGVYDTSSHATTPACAVTGTYVGPLTCANSPATVGPGTGSGTVVPVIDYHGEKSSNFQVTNANGSWSITQQPVEVTYTSFGWYSTRSQTDKGFNALLSATVVGADIRTATVTFKEGSTVLCTADVGLVNPSDKTVGVASCYWNSSLSGSDAESHTITVVVDGNYSGQSDPIPVTISPASITNFITGGGHLVLTNSSGAKPGEMHSKMNFGFTVKYNKSGTNPQGKVTAILRAADGHHYQIKSTAIDSLSVQPVNLTKKTTGFGVFTAKCVITDLTAGGVPVPGQYTLKLYAQDNGEPGGPKWAEDQLYLVVFNSAGGIWFSSNWTNNQTTLQPIMNGNLQVH